MLLDELKATSKIMVGEPTYSPKTATRASGCFTLSRSLYRPLLEDYQPLSFRTLRESRLELVVLTCPSSKMFLAIYQTSKKGVLCYGMRYTVH